MTVASLEEVDGYRHGRVPRAVRVNQIETIAAELFTERGYAGTSMEEITRRAGVSRPVVYDLAGSKAELFCRVLDRRLGELVATITAAIADSADVWVGLRAGLAAFFRFGDANPAELELVIAGSGDPELDQRLATLRARSNRHVAELFAALARDAGTAIEPRLARGLAAAVQGATDYVARWRHAEAVDLTPEAAADLVVGLVEPGLRTALVGSTTNETHGGM